MKESISTLIEKLNNLKILQTTYEFEELIPKEIWDEYFEGKYEAVDWDLDVDTHRWYETSVTVLKFSDGFMGVRFITNMFSESQDYEDCYHHLEFMEMEEYKTVSYRAKKD